MNLLVLYLSRSPQLTTQLLSIPCCWSTLHLLILPLPSSGCWAVSQRPVTHYIRMPPWSQYPAKISSAPSTRAAQKLFERSGSWFHEATQSLTFSFHPYVETSGYDLISDPLINYNFSLGYQVKIQPEKQNQEKVYMKILMASSWLPWLRGQQGMSAIHRAGCQEGETNSPAWAEALSAGGIFFLREVSALALGSFTWFNQAHPCYLEENQLIIDFNHIYKILP